MSLTNSRRLSLEGLEFRYLMTSLGQADDPAPIELSGYEGHDYFVADNFSFAEMGDHCGAAGKTNTDSVTYRPVRITTKPSVQGVQPAVTLGPASEEHDPDHYGQVKVQFPSDREGRDDENSSCWIRVSQVHAGNGFGGIDIPRIGVNETINVGAAQQVTVGAARALTVGAAH